MSNINTLAGYINNDCVLTRELCSLSEQVFFKLVRYEGLRIKNKRLIVETNLQYDIKELILNIISSAGSLYRKDIDSNFYLNEDEENQMIELMYYMITKALIIKVKA